MDHSNILGVVLAGGKSQRFGEDKCQVKLGDKLLIDYILSEIVEEFKEDKAKNEEIAAKIKNYGQNIFNNVIIELKKYI